MTDVHVAGGPSKLRADLDVATIIAVVLERWRLVVRVLAVIGILTVALLLLQRRRYEAAMTLTTVGGGGISGAGIAATLLAAASQGGLQATPPFVEQLVHLPGVLREIANAPADATSRKTILSRVAELANVDSVPNDEVPDVVGGLITTAIQRETGTIALRVRSEDSGLARTIAAEVVRVVGKTFIDASRAQASELRRAQQARVDSATNQLDRAERAQLDFTSRNRVQAPYAPSVLMQNRLDREVQIARQVFQSAVTDREAAIAQELQETPAVVVLDPMPATLPPVRRHRVVKLLLTLVLSSILLWMYLVMVDAPRPPDERPSQRMARAWTAFREGGPLYWATGAVHGARARHRSS